MQLYTDKYKHLYKELLSKTADDSNLAWFVSAVGKRYTDTPDKRFMVVGRALNGWDKKNPLQEIDEYKQCPEPDWSWLTERSDNPSDDNANRSRHNASAFWRTTRMICNKLLCTDGNDYLDYLVWSNLFKAAPFDRGNPSARTRQKQIDVCVDILAYEIKTMKPKYIYFCTGEYHTREFLEIPYSWGGNSTTSVRSVFKALGLESSPLESYTCDNKIVFRTGQIDWSERECSKIVVAERPEGKKEKVFARSVINAFLE